MTARRHAFMRNLNTSTGESGELVSTEGLAGPKQAKLVRAGKDGAPITDGIAARASAATGPGGTPINMPIEVRQMLRSLAGAVLFVPFRTQEFRKRTLSG